MENYFLFILFILINLWYEDFLRFDVMFNNWKILVDIKDLLDTKVKSRLDIEQATTMPFIGDVPKSVSNEAIISSNIFLISQWNIRQKHELQQTQQSCWLVRIPYRYHRISDYFGRYRESLGLWGVHHSSL